MGTVTDTEVLAFARREYPYDYSMQKFVYDKQVADKRYMSAMPETAAKAAARREYPYDYSMQKFVYDRSVTR